MQQTKIKVPDALWKAVFGYSPYNNSDYPDIHFAWWIPNNSYAIQEKLDYSNPIIVVDGQIQPNRKTRSSEDAAFTISIETLEARLNREMRDINSEISYDFLGHIQDIERKKQIKELIKLLPATSG